MPQWTDKRERQYEHIRDSALERGLTDKPLDPDTVVDFSLTKALRF